MTLEEFIDSPLRNAWINEPGICIYVRKFMVRFDVANVEVQADLQRQGVFKAWLKKAEDLVAHKFDVMHVENVHNQHLPAFLKRVGYVESIDNPNCYLKVLNA